MFSKKELLAMSPSLIKGLTTFDVKRILSTEEIECIFKTCNAFWHHPEEKNIKAPHAKLTTGKHSDIYVNCPLVLSRSDLCQIMAWQIIYRLNKIYFSNIDWVVSSDSSALALSKDVANTLNVKWHPMQKTKNSAGKEIQVWEKMVIKPYEYVLHVEELMVTSTTALRVRNGIRKAHPDYPIKFVPFLPVLVFRPQKNNNIEKIDNSKILPVLSYETFVVDPKKETCPLCAKGSKALKPKGENWVTMIESM